MPISLGPRTLRAETAALAALGVLAGPTSTRNEPGGAKSGAGARGITAAWLGSQMRKRAGPAALAR